MRKIIFLLLLSSPGFADKFNACTGCIDFTGGSSGIVSPGTFTWQNSHGLDVGSQSQFYLTRTLPADETQAVWIGTFTETQGAGLVNIRIAFEAMINGHQARTARNYYLATYYQSVAADDTWVEIAPPLDVDGSPTDNRYYLEASQYNYTVLRLRIRPTSSNLATAIMYLNISYSKADPSDTFTPDSTVQTGIFPPPATTNYDGIPNFFGNINVHGVVNNYQIGNAPNQAIVNGGIMEFWGGIPNQITSTSSGDIIFGTNDSITDKTTTTEIMRVATSSTGGKVSVISPDGFKNTYGIVTSSVVVSSNTILGNATHYAAGAFVTPSTVTANNWSGGGLSTCGSSSQAEGFSTTTGQWSCQTITAAGIGALTGNQSITLSGDASGSGTTAITVTAATLQANINSFSSSVTVRGTGIANTYGIITSTIQVSSNTILGNATHYMAGAFVTPSTVTANNYQGAGLATCGSTSQAQSYNATTGQFGCTTITAAGLGALTGNQSITVSGDSSGSGTTAITLTEATLQTHVNSFSSSITVSGAGILNTYGITTGSVTLNSISAPSVPPLGTIWNDSTYNAFASSVGLTLQNIPTTLFTIKASSHTDSTTGPINWLGSGDTLGTIILPPNFFKVGKSIYIVLYGTHSRTGTPTFTPLISLGGTTILSTGAITMGAYTLETPGQPWKLEAELSCYSTGGSGVIWGTGILTFYNSDILGTSTVMKLSAGANTINTAAAQALQFTTTFGTANAANSMTINAGHATVMY